MHNSSYAIRWFAAVVGLSSILTASGSELGPIDFRYALPWWQTSICLPDDPDKPLAGKDGQCLFDFGGGGVRNFGLSVQPEIAGDSKWVRQETASPRVPIIRTFKDAAGVEVIEEIFVVTPGTGAKPSDPIILRLDGPRRLHNWAKPNQACSPVFKDVDVSFGGGGIRLQIKSAKPATVVFGLCEGWHKEAGDRPLVLQTEGAESRTVDPVRDFGHNEPGLYRASARDTNGDGFVEVKVSTPEGAKDRNAILNALWVFTGNPPGDAQILSGKADDQALAVYAGDAGPERRVVLLMKLRNNTGRTATREISLRVDGTAQAGWNDAEQWLRIGNTRIAASEHMNCEGKGTPKCVLKLDPITIDPRAERDVAFTIDRRRSSPAGGLSAAEARRARDAAQKWWEAADLPYQTIQLPDPGVQALLDSCIRNIWQAREIRGGKPAFHVGPTVYRGLWVVDGSFLLEAAALLDRAHDARAGIEYLLSHQKADGSFELLRAFWKENGIVLWTATRHAHLTQDKAWLRAQWPILRRVVQAVKHLRAQTLSNPDALEYGVLPGGEVDGGISNPPKSAPEFSNAYWCLTGLKAIIGAAHWLGEREDAAEWQKEYDSFYEATLNAMRRDMLKDEHGNAYVPTMMANARKLPPQKGQWAFCHAVYPGQVFAADDRLVTSQIEMLRDTKVQGMVFDTGWMAQGIWTYFGSFYGHAVLWQGRGREAAEVLYDFGRHAAPTRLWREEQKPVGKGSQEVGDMPHNWASAEFIRLTAHLLQLDRGEELHLLEGFPREWAGPGMLTRLNGMPTPFGRLNLECRIADDGGSARIKLARLARQPARIVLHLKGLNDSDPIELPTGEAVEKVIRLK